MKTDQILGAYEAPAVKVIKIEAITPITQSSSTTEGFEWDPEEDF